MTAALLRLRIAADQLLGREIRAGDVVEVALQEPQEAIPAGALVAVTGTCERRRGQWAVGVLAYGPAGEVRVSTAPGGGAPPQDYWCCEALVLLGRVVLRERTVDVLDGPGPGPDPAA